MTEITLIEGETLASVPIGIVGLLCETAKDGNLARRFPGAIGLAELAGSFDQMKHRAHALARKILANEPLLRGVRQLEVFEELLIRDLQRTFHALNLLEWLEAHFCSICHFEGESWITQKLTALATLKQAPLELRFAKASVPCQARRLARVFSRVSQSGFSRASLQQELRQVVELFDPYHVSILRPAGRSDWKADEIWFYTTARTFTQIGLAYEPHFPSPFRFLVENPATGGAPLAEQRRPYSSVYEFADGEFAPTPRESVAAAQAIEEHILSVHLSGEESLARDSLLGGSFLAEFKHRLLPQALFFTSTFDRWAETTRPRALVVGNPVFEGPALHAAKRHNIPTVLLQHGILGDFCQFVDPPADHYVVRGEFWRDFLAEGPRRRAKILNIPGDRKQTGLGGAEGREILFLTTPYSLHGFQHREDLRDILRTLMLCAQSSKRELIVRVHPLEKVGLYRDHVADIAQREKIDARVTYSQGAGLEDVIKRAAVAVTYSSTAFLDCLRLNVPIVSFGWHDFAYKEQIADRQVFNFASDLEELRNLVLAAIAGRLRPFSGNDSDFLAPTPAELLRSSLAEFVDHAPEWGAAELQRA